jgi:hypothetical protein
MHSCSGIAYGRQKKKRAGAPQNPGSQLTNEKRKRSCYYFFFLAAGFFLAAVFFAAFFLAAIIHYLLREFCRPDGIFCNPSGFAAELQRRSLCDLGGFTKWVASSRLCGDNQVSQRHTSCLDTGMARVRQGVDKIFFREVSSEVFRMWDVHHGVGPLQGPSTHRMRALRNNLVRGVSRSRRRENFSPMVGATAHRGAQLSLLITAC